MKRGPALEINVPKDIEASQKPFSLYVLFKQTPSFIIAHPCLRTSTGTFKEGDLAINKKGLLIKGESPKTTPNDGPQRVCITYLCLMMQ